MFQGAEQYFKGLSDLGQQFFNLGQAKDSSWSGALDGLMRATGFAGADKHEALLERLMGQSKAYLGMLEKLYQAASTGATDYSNVDFAGLAKQWLDDMGKQNPFMANPGANNFAWPQMANFNPQTLLNDWLNTPAFGYAREHQERQQELLKHTLSYHNATQRYNELSAKSVQKAIDLMQSKLAARAEPGRELDSLKAIYDLWIDALEESFAETALSDEYQKAYGQLVDAQMRVRANVQKQIELATGNVGMPTRTELEGVHQKLAEVRRQLRGHDHASSSTHSHDEIAELRAEINELREQIKQLKAGTDKPSNAATSTVAKAKNIASNLIKTAQKVSQRAVPKANKAPVKAAAQPATKRR